MKINHQNKLITYFLLEHFTKIQLHLGSKYTKSHFLSEGYISYIVDHSSILKIQKLIKSWKLFSFILYYSFLKRNVFIFSIFNNILLEVGLLNFLKNKLNNINSSENLIFKRYTLYLLGFINNFWIGGLLSNWQIVFFNLHRILSKKTKLKKKDVKYLLLLKYFWFRKAHPNFPDFILNIDSKTDFLRESKQWQIPVLGMSSIKDNLFFYTYNLISNTKSFRSMEFFLEEIFFVFKKARKEEKLLFFRLIFLKITKILKSKRF